MKILKRVHTDSVIGLGLAATSAVLLIREFQAGERKDIFGKLNEKILGEKFFPAFVLGSIIVFAVALSVRSFRLAGQDSEPLKAFVQRTRIVWLVLFLSVLYCGLLYAIGYLPASVIVLALLLRAFGQKNWIYILLPSVALPLVFYLVFEKALMLMLPKGLLF